MRPTRLKSSFIYLANAVNDLRSNGAALSAALAPIVLLAALALLPDALNLQQLLADRFAPGTRHIAWIPVQVPFAQSTADAKMMFPWWAILLFHLGVLVLTVISNLVILCTLRRAQAGNREAGVLNEAIATWRETIALIPGFFWVVFLQLIGPIIALSILGVNIATDQLAVQIAVYIFDLVLLVGAILWFLWLYFAEYALVFNGQRSFHALLFSRDLMRKRFFRVAMRIVVFLAIWSGYDSWAAGAFFVASLFLGPVGVITGYFWTMIFLVELAGVAVTYVTMAFFVAASLRLYQDSVESCGVAVTAVSSDGLAATLPLPAANA